MHSFQCFTKHGFRYRKLLFLAFLPAICYAYNVLPITSSSSVNLCHLKYPFSLGNKQKSLNAKYGKYGGRQEYFKPGIFTSKRQKNPDMHPLLNIRALSSPLITTSTGGSRLPNWTPFPSSPLPPLPFPSSFPSPPPSSSLP